MNLALVHEWLTNYAGSEKVLEAMGELYPGAPIHALVHNPEPFVGTGLHNRQVITSFLQKLPFAVKKHQWYLPLMPLAVEQHDLSEFDVVLSCSHAVAKGVLTRGDQLHISYLCTPMRYAWDLYQEYLHSSGLARKKRGWLARMMLHRLRQWDISAANRTDVYVCLSHYIARRIWKVYRKRSFVIYPPVEIERFTPDRPREDFFLAVSRLTPYKRMELIVEAFAQLDWPLVVVGDGPQRKLIERLAGRNTTLLGWQADEVIADLYQRCRAFVFAADEDFGIVPVEAQAAGAPVIAFGKGGATETVVDGETGLFFREQTVDSLVEALRRFEATSSSFDAATCRRNAERFSRERFKREIEELVTEQWSRFREGRALREPGE